MDFIIIIIILKEHSLKSLSYSFPEIQFGKYYSMHFAFCETKVENIAPSPSEQVENIAPTPNLLSFVNDNT